MFRWSFHPRSRHPLARLLAILIGAIALVAVLAFGLFAAVALIIGGSIVLLVNAMRTPRPADAASPSARPTPPGVIEGEFKVVHDSRAERQPAR